MNNRSKIDGIPSSVTNPKTKVTYQRGSFLGKGGFAKCYEFIEIDTGNAYAGKVVSKTMLMKPHHKEKMFQEIQIHSSLSHKYIVSLHSYFEDDNNIYIILELCRKRSLMEMHKRRKNLTLPEVRYFMHQLVLACKYMHDNKIIHRDLKLGNLFLNDDMELKVGDFGLATRLSFDGERKKTVCGTPNYIAPEILTKQGHSFEVDMWSLGCIMYTLLIGMPPFETRNLTATYNKIKKCDYQIPSKLDPNAKNLIKKLLHPDPKCRPNADSILSDSFLTSGHIPSRLPTSCLTMQPRLAANLRLSVDSDSSRKPLTEMNNNPKVSLNEKGLVAAAAEMEIAPKNAGNNLKPGNTMPKDFFLGGLRQILFTVLERNPENLFSGHLEDAQDPSAVPFIWISKWVDYTDKYGIGYQLCDNSIGVFFNDATHLVLLADGKNVQYIDRNNDGCYFTTDSYPSDIKKKITLLNYFNTYMSEHLLKAGENAKPREGDEMTQVPYLRAWFRTKSAVIFHLTNGTFQTNFFKDHTKVILCPVMGAVSYIDEEKNFSVFTFKLIKKYGCLPILASKLRYVKGMVEKLYSEYLKHEGAEKYRN